MTSTHTSARQPYQSIVLASCNLGKLDELRALVSASSLASCVLDLDALDLDEPEETEATYVDNACKKALHGFLHSGFPSLGDDGGIEIEALDGAPGLRTARFTAAAGGPDAAMGALRRDLERVGSPPPWRATLRCALALALDESEVIVAEGHVSGHVEWPPGIEGPGLFRIFRTPEHLPPPSWDAQRLQDAIAHANDEVAFDPAAPVLLHRLRAYSALLQQLG